MNLNRLRTFFVVHRARGIRAGAKRLHVTPAAVSVAIKTLEGELGQPLFTRLGHDLVPTKSGTALFEMLSRFFADLDQTLTNLDEDARQIRGTIRVGAPNGFGVQTLVPYIRAFQAEHPSVRSVIRFGPPDRLMTLLAADDIDMAVVPRTHGKTSFAVTSVKLAFTYEPVLVCSRALYEERVKGKRTYDRVAALAHVALWGGTERLRSWYRRHFKKNPEISIVAEVDNIFAAISAVRHGGCVALLPSDIIADAIASKELVSIFPSKRSQKFSYRLVRLKTRTAYLVETEFSDFLRAAPSISRAS